MEIESDDVSSGSQGERKGIKPFPLNEKEYDAGKLAALLRLCKGDRTTTDFSKNTGVSITYLTKLLNGNSPSRPSKKYLRRIAYPEFGKAQGNVSYFDLLRAAGYSDDENEKIPAKSNIAVPDFAKRRSFPIAFMIDNLTAAGEIGSGFNIQNYDHDGWFIIDSMNSKILCVPAIYDGAENVDRKQRIALNFMVAATTQTDLDKYYILTNQRNFAEEIKTVLPKLPGIDLCVIETLDYQQISERKLVY